MANHLFKQRRPLRRIFSDVILN